MKPIPFFLQRRFLDFQGKYILAETAGFQIALYGEKNLTSPLKAPFGGFWTTENPTPAGLQRLIERIDLHAANTNARSLEIQLAPECYYDPEMRSLVPLLTKAGFQQQWTDLNFHLPVGEPIRRHLHRSERWKLNKSERLEFSFRQVLKADWHQVHSFILASRLRKGYGLSMTEDELRESEHYFPEHYRVWEVVEASGKTAALAVSVQISSSIEYVFYTADDPAWRRWSPVVMLIAGIYETVRLEGKQVLDLGTASQKGIVNHGVAAFKRFLGGIPSAKIRVRKTFFSEAVDYENPE